MKRGQIKITKHAKQRLRERVPLIQETSYPAYVAAARYNGLSVTSVSVFDKELGKKLERYTKGSNSTQVRIYKGVYFVFKGNKSHARTLVTVFTMPENMMSKLDMCI